MADTRKAQQPRRHQLARGRLRAGSRLLVLAFLAVLVFPAVAFANGSSSKTTVETAGAVIAGIVALVGLPTAILTFRKTQVEIRKLELEARQLEASTPGPHASEDLGYRIQIADSTHVNIQILADPRFLGPLLLLLDFIVAWIVLTFAGYASSVLDLGAFNAILLAAFGVALLGPILREALRVKRALAPRADEQQDAAAG